jgi:hypothetical protein
MGEPVSFKMLTDFGILLEINRKVLHPIGLEIAARDRAGVVEATITNVGAGHSFGRRVLDTDEVRAKAGRFGEIRDRNAAVRRALWGWSIEQIPGLVEEQPLSFAWTEESLAALVEAGVAGARGLADQIFAWAEALDGEADVINEMRNTASALESGGSDVPMMIADTLSRLVVSRSGVVRAKPDTERSEAQKIYGLHLGAAGRVLYLAQILPEIAHGNVAEDGTPRPINGALYADEIEEVEALAQEVAGWAKNDPPPERAQEVAQRLEDLYGLCQPGMRFFRGDEGAEAAWRAVKDAVADEIEAWQKSRPEVDRFLAGDVGADAVDRDKVRAEIAMRLASLDEAEASAVQEVEAIRRSAAPLREAMKKISNPV